MHHLLLPGLIQEGRLTGSKPEGVINCVNPATQVAISSSRRVPGSVDRSRSKQEVSFCRQQKKNSSMSARGSKSFTHVKQTIVY